MKDTTKRGLECVTLLTLAGVFAHLNAVRADDPVAERTIWSTDYQEYLGSSTITVGGTVRTFRPGNIPGGHADFRRVAQSGPGRYANIMGDALSPTGRPEFRSGGQSVDAEARDASGNIISPARSYIASRPGDTPARLDTARGDAVSSNGSFSHWFRDVPGANDTSQVRLSFNREGSRYVFDGSLDSITGTRSVDYTAESSFYFVNEAGRDYYLLAESSAEVWVYIDGRLVIDGGGIAGAKFDIVDGAVVPAEPVDASIVVVGSAIQNGSASVPVTMCAIAGHQTFEPFGRFNDPASGNVNDNRNPRNATLISNLPAGTPISVNATSWLAGSRTSALAPFIAAQSTPVTRQVKVLRNGDNAPNIHAFQNQASVQTYLQPYIDTRTGHITLAANQAIFLFELGTTSLGSNAADFQDLVVLVTLSRTTDGSSESDSSTSTQSNSPALSQRIDLSRLAWLQDRGSYRMQIFFANRTGADSHLRLETNIATLNLANRPVWPGKD